MFLIRSIATPRARALRTCVQAAQFSNNFFKLSFKPSASRKSKEAQQEQQKGQTKGQPPKAAGQQQKLQQQLQKTQQQLQRAQQPTPHQQYQLQQQKQQKLITRQVEFDLRTETELEPSKTTEAALTWQQHSKQQQQKQLQPPQQQQQKQQQQPQLQQPQLQPPQQQQQQQKQQQQKQQQQKQLQQPKRLTSYSGVAPMRLTTAKPKVPANPKEKPSISNQRDKWVSRVSPELKRKASDGGQEDNEDPKAAAAAPVKQPQFTKFVPAAAPMKLPQVAPAAAAQPWPKTRSPDEEAADEMKGASSETNRKSWLNRMHGAQQRKQSQWLKDLQAKQETGRKIHQEKVQQLQKQNPTPVLKQPTSSMSTLTTAVSVSAPPASPKSPEHLAYLEAVRHLNNYQPRDRTPGRAQSKRKTQADPVIEETIKCLEKTGLGLSDVERIPVIQVAGTKGRGSTCHIIESILSAHGVTTGVLCSPHLFLTRERIRINGEPLPENQFTELYWQVQHKLDESKLLTPANAYNKLLTIMAFHAFERANVEVAIVEVGNACGSDCTNFTRHARTIGISTLGWEQSFDLSSSMRDIAWNKAFIMKPDANVFTSVTQPECCEVLSQRAKQLGVKLHRVPVFHDYVESNLPNKKLLTQANHTLRLNGSLGIQLAYDFLRQYKPEYVVGFEPNCTTLTQSASRGIEMLNHTGQFEFIKHDMFNVFLDCADTLESMKACHDWFYARTRSSRSPKVLLFNKVNEFNAKDLLTVLRLNLRFEEACFVPSPNYFEGEQVEEDDAKAVVWHGMEELQRAKRNAGNWRALCEEAGRKDNSQLSISIGSFFEYLQNKYGKQKYGMRNELDVLVTGSRQLVAATMTALAKMGKERAL